MKTIIKLSLAIAISSTLIACSDGGLNSESIPKSHVADSINPPPSQGDTAANLNPSETEPKEEICWFSKKPS